MPMAAAEATLHAPPGPNARLLSLLKTMADPSTVCCFDIEGLLGDPVDDIADAVGSVVVAVGSSVVAADIAAADDDTVAAGLHVPVEPAECDDERPGSSVRRTPLRPAAEIPPLCPVAALGRRCPDTPRPHPSAAGTLPASWAEQSLAGHQLEPARCRSCARCC